MSLSRRVVAAQQTLAGIALRHAPAALASSFGAEDMVLVDLIAREKLAIEVLTLDTGRLPRETLDLLDRIRDRYGVAIAVHTPRAADVEAYVDKHGLDGFYDSLGARKACCAVRKVEPLQRALAGKRAWITGLRREQSDTRTSVPLEDHDAVRGLWKFNPLAEWSNQDVWKYLQEFDVPYNALHDRGYPSIGCAPCTRAVKPGEHPRAGRWWWEQEGARKECGLHTIPVRVTA